MIPIQNRIVKNDWMWCGDDAMSHKATNRAGAGGLPKPKQNDGGYAKALDDYLPLVMMNGMMTMAMLGLLVQRFETAPMAFFLIFGALTGASIHKAVTEE